MMRFARLALPLLAACASEVAPTEHELGNVYVEGVAPYEGAVSEAWIARARVDALPPSRVELVLDRARAADDIVRLSLRIEADGPLAAGRFELAPELCAMRLGVDGAIRSVDRAGSTAVAVAPSVVPGRLHLAVSARFDSGQHGGGDVAFAVDLPTTSTRTPYERARRRRYEDRTEGRDDDGDPGPVRLPDISIE